MMLGLRSQSRMHHFTNTPLGVGVRGCTLVWVLVRSPPHSTLHPQVKWSRRAATPGPCLLIFRLEPAGDHQGIRTTPLGQEPLIAYGHCRHGKLTSRRLRASGVLCLPGMLGWTSHSLPFFLRVVWTLWGCLVWGRPPHPPVFRNLHRGHAWSAVWDPREGWGLAPWVLCVGGRYPLVKRSQR